MLTREVRDAIPELVDVELAAGCQQHGSFHSFHEGYAVMLEEWDEATEQMALVDNALAELWAGVRENRPCDEMLLLALDCEEYAINTIGELVQLAAMAKKMRVLCVEVQDFAEEEAKQ